jgi:hypothetical protein
VATTVGTRTRASVHSNKRWRAGMGSPGRKRLGATQRSGASAWMCTPSVDGRRPLR